MLTSVATVATTLSGDFTTDEGKAVIGAVMALLGH